MTGDGQVRLRQQVPEGVRDRLPGEGYRLREVTDRLLELFRRWGYREVVTPAFEFLEAAVAGEASRPEDCYRFFDRRGRTLALRPDMTAAVARLAATRLAGEPLPLRLSYWGPVFRRREERAGALHEIWQAGVEQVGLAGGSADAELVALACEALAEAGLEGFQVSVGHVAFLEGVLEEAGVTPAQGAAIREALAARDLVAFEAVAREAPGAELLLAVAEFRGSAQEAAARFGHLANPRIARALGELQAVFALLEAYGVAERVSLDLALVRSFGYYTGVVFEGYAPGVGAPVLGGGRYDGLLAAFAGDGRPLPAVGFAVDLDRVLTALGRQGQPPAEPALDLLLVPEPGAEGQALAQAREFRRAGLAVEVELERRTPEERAAYVKARQVREVRTVAADSRGCGQPARRIPPRPPGVVSIH
ncbi:MAG: ATP phosphoribosyltransferase regulatory subunit [Firmicutes bacterium]|nr:ATP phosphoribosyltransferase regulatory subunit [Bacillota bacterium]